MCVVSVSVVSLRCVLTLFAQRADGSEGGSLGRCLFQLRKAGGCRVGVRELEVASGSRQLG